MGHKTYREASKQNWYPGDGVFPTEKINSGSLQRIADACELMAKNHKQLIEERDMYERSFQRRKAYAESLERTIRSLKGVITKLRRQTKDRRDGK